MNVAVVYQFNKKEQNNNLLFLKSFILGRYCLFLFFSDVQFL